MGDEPRRAARRRSKPRLSPDMAEHRGARRRRVEPAGSVQDTIGRYADRGEDDQSREQGRCRCGGSRPAGRLVARSSSGAQFDADRGRDGPRRCRTSRRFRAGRRAESADQRRASVSAIAPASGGFSRSCPQARCRSCVAARELRRPGVDAACAAAVRGQRPRSSHSRPRRIERIDELRGQARASPRVHARPTFSWLADRPLLEEHLKGKTLDRRRARAPAGRVLDPAPGRERKP